MCCQAQGCLAVWACEHSDRKYTWRSQSREILVSIMRNGYTCFQIMARRFFRSSIQELEALCKEKHNNVDFLLVLEEELSHRKTERAARLRNQITERLAVFRPRTPSREQVSAEPPPPQSSQHQSVPHPHGKQEPSHPHPLRPENPVVSLPSGGERASAAATNY